MEEEFKLPKKYSKEVNQLKSGKYNEMELWRDAPEIKTPSKDIKLNMGCCDSKPQMQRLERNEPEVIIVIGGPGSGKSTQ